MKVYLERKGIVLSRITVHKYMNKELGLVSIVRRKKPTYESGEAHKKSVDVYSSPYRVGGVTQDSMEIFIPLTENILRVCIGVKGGYH